MKPFLFWSAKRETVSSFRREKDAGGGFGLHRSFCQDLRVAAWASLNRMALSSGPACAAWGDAAVFLLHFGESCDMVLLALPVKVGPLYRGQLLAS